MRRFKHSLEHLSRLPKLAQECDISQVRIVSQDVRQHGETPYVVTTFAVEVWEQGFEAVTLGSALTELHERQPAQEPYIVVETSSIENGLVGIERFADRTVARLALKRKFDSLMTAFTALTDAGGEHDPAA